MRAVSATMRHASAACLPVALLAVAPAAALAQAPSPETPRPQTRSPDIPDQKLDFAGAALNKVGDVKRNYEQQLVKAPPADKERITNEANQAL